jgi:hypothetical protein
MMRRPFLSLVGAMLLGCVGDSTVIPTDAGMDSLSNPDIAVETSTMDVGAGCEAGAMACGGTCVAVMSDPANCGRCAHDCGMGASCSAGVCQPVQVTTTPGAVSLTTDIYSDNPTGVATHVFWAAPGPSGGVFQDNVTGGNKIMLSTTSGGGSNDVAVTGSSVYWPNYNPGNGALTLLEGNVSAAMTQNPVATGGLFGGVQGIVIDPNTKYLFGSFMSGSGTNYGVYECLNMGTTCTSVVSFAGLAAINIATDATYVYMADQNSGVIKSVQISNGSSASIVMSQSTPNLLRVNGTFLFWSNSGGMTIMRSQLTGASPIQVASTSAPATGLAADAVNAYWTDSTAGTVNYAPIGGGGSTTPYVTQGVSTDPMRLVRDTKSLFWIHSGVIWRVALP